MNKQLRIGIAGFGKMGRIRAQTIEDNPQTNLVSIYDINMKDVELDDSIIKCDSFDELLNSDIDAVILSTYVNASSDYTIRALKAGKHVLCEKPPARNAKELESVIEVEEKTSLILKYCFNHRYHYSVSEAKKIIDSGSMGELLWMRGVYGKAGSIDYHDSWRNYKQYSGGGILIDQGIHMLDLMRYLSGQELTCVHSILSTSYWDIEEEDNAFITMKTNNNIVATLHSSATQWQHKFLLEMEFEEGYVNLDGILSSTRSYAPEKLVTGRREFEDVTFAMGKPAENITYFESDPSWELELEEFIAAINSHDSIRHGTSQDAVEIMRLIDNIYDQDRVRKNIEK